MIPKLLDPVQDADTVDGMNELQRTADRSAHLFALYPCQVGDRNVSQKENDFVYLYPRKAYTRINYLMHIT